MKGVSEICEKRLEFSQVHLASIFSFDVCSIQTPVELGAIIREVPKDFSLCAVLLTFRDCFCCFSIEISEVMCWSADLPSS